MGTPPINVFTGKVEKEKVWIGSDCVLDAKGVADQEVYVAIRPEGFVLSEQKDNTLSCKLQAVEVMGRDVSVVAKHPLCENAVIRAIIPSENKVNTTSGEIKFELKKNKVFLFHKETEERV